VLITYSSTVTPSAPSWHQATGRNVAASCELGWSPSWAQWPNGNTGGYVCNKEIYMTGSGSWSSRTHAAAADDSLGMASKPVLLTARGC
jgi:hypothetical protein